jgi:hypothetical protein
MVEKITTEDCVEAIKSWYKEYNRDYPGSFKRIKKFKNSDGEVVRLFESKAAEVTVKVTEKPHYLDVMFAEELVGKNYYFGFGEDENYMEGEEPGVCFYVVEKEYFDQNGHIDSVHFTDQYDMPSKFEEVMESCFVVQNSTEEEVRKELYALGFSEKKELTEMLSGQ